MSDRLEQALAVFLEFDAGRESPEAFIARHDELRDLLEPMFGDEVATPDEGSPQMETLGDFRILEEIGRGGMGVVYAARQLSLDRKVALKVLAGHMTLQPSAIARFKQEAQTAARLQHPNIVEVLAVGSEGSNHYFAMEFIDGQPLDRWCAEQNPDLATRVELCRDIALALQMAHGRGVIHRDVKPSNILVDRQGRPHLSDFGLAREEGLPSMTATGAFAGTPYYVAPEQVRGAAGVDARADVFSLGVTLYELCCGARPFEAQTSALVLRKIQEEEPRTPTDLPKDLSAIILHALEKNAEARYPTALALAEDLQAYLAGQPVRARHLTRAQRLGRWAGRRPGVAAMGVALLLTFVVSFAWILNNNRELRTTLDELRQLSDVRLIEGYLAQHNHIPAGRPEDLPRLEAWLAEVEKLLQRAPRHRARLQQLRSRALPYTEQDRQRDRNQSRHIPREKAIHTNMESIKAVLQKYADVEEPEQELRDHLANLHVNLANYQAQLQRITPDLERRRTWKFTANEDIWVHSVLTKLVEGLDKLTDAEEGTYTLFKRKRDLLRDFDKTWLEPYRKVWRDAAEDVQADPRFGGMQLKPQFGLVPLGKDPLTGLWEFGHPMSGALPERDSRGNVIFDEETCLVFVLIPGGDSLVGAEPPTEQEPHGSKNRDRDAHSREAPIRTIRLDPFFLSKYEMTQGQWAEVLGRRPSQHRAGNRTSRVWNTDAHPVETIAWVTAKEVMDMLSLRMPNEVEWEHAARAGTDSPWYTGVDPVKVVYSGNLADLAFRDLVKGSRDIQHSSHNDGYGGPSPVDAFGPNPFGLHGIMGNVLEFCGDAEPVPTPDGAPQTNFRDQVARGGCFLDMPRLVRHSARQFVGYWNKFAEFGLRPARSVQ